jgi:hypothetical protein
MTFFSVKGENRVKSTYPFVLQIGTINPRRYQRSGVIGGEVLNAGALLTIVAWIVIAMVDNRKRRSIVTRDGGITYRKD